MERAGRSWSCGIGDRNRGLGLPRFGGGTTRAKRGAGPPKGYNGATMEEPTVTPSGENTPTTFGDWSRRHPNAFDAHGELRTSPSEEAAADWLALKPIPYCRLLPPEAFPGEPFLSDHRPDPWNHPVVAMVLASHCSGGKLRPGPADLYRGMRRKTPSPIERFAIRTWWCEATTTQILEALCTGVYSARDLATKLHEYGWSEGRFDLVRALNGYCTREWNATRRKEDPWYDQR